MGRRNHLLDAIKAILALGVVFAHYQFPGYFGKIMASLGTMGVIVFFLITGYQSSTEDGTGPKKLLSRAKRNLAITIVAFAPIASARLHRIGSNTKTPTCTSRPST